MGSITYEKLFALVKKQYGTETLYLRKQGFSPTLVNKLKNNKCVTTDTIIKLCDLLHCTPDDIMTYHASTEDQQE